MFPHSFIPVIMRNEFSSNTQYHDINGPNTANQFTQYIINNQQQQQLQQQQLLQQQLQQQQAPQQLIELSNLQQTPQQFASQTYSVNNTATICQQPPIYQQNISCVPITLQLQPQHQVIQPSLIQRQTPINTIINTINNTRNNNEPLFVTNANGQVLGTINQNMLIPKDTGFNNHNNNNNNHNNNNNMNIHHIPARIEQNLPPKIDFKIPNLPSFISSQSHQIQCPAQPQIPSKALTVHTDNTLVTTQQKQQSVRSHLNKSATKPNTSTSSKTNKEFVCSICGKQYKYRCNYKSHFKIHTDDCYKCEFCGKRFGRKSNYREHVRVHTGESPFKCTFCEKQFKQRHGWKDHLRVHTGEKPYQCDICNKRFSVGHNLNVHKRIHTGERPFHCNLCQKSYRQKSSFNSHTKNVHGVV